jgi:pyruvate dehydrogenase E1 component alpha subunit
MSKISHDSILRAGRYRGLSLAGMDPQVVKKLYWFMLRLRRCEEALAKEYHPADEMRCPVHFCVGQEAVPAALSMLLAADDYLFSHHRTHGYYLAKGLPMRALFAELYGRETGANGGMAGSQDISMPSLHFYSGAILAGATALSVGAALAFQLKGSSQIAVAGFGEAASDEGLFWETVSYAALRKLPLVLLCENNNYSVFSPQSKRQPADNISERVASFGVKSHAVFGNDVALVYSTLTEAIANARAGSGPCFIEAYTYRWSGHYGPESDDLVGYRPQSEVQAWKANCPIALLEEAMFAEGLLDSAAKLAMMEEIDKEIGDAFAFAKNSSFPAARDWAAMNCSRKTPLADKLLTDFGPVQFDENQAVVQAKGY